MPATLTIVDQSTAGQTLNEWKLEVLTEHITIHELIRSRVYQEVQDHNQDQPEVYNGLVVPTNAEQSLNGVKVKRPLDWKKQVEIALSAFENKQMLILIDDHQAQSLDEVIEIEPTTKVAFLRLVLLVGG